MSAVQRFTRQRFAVTTVLFSALGGGAAAFESGPPTGHTGAFGEPDCTACHFDYDANEHGGTLTIGGAPEVFVAGKRYELSIVLQHPDIEVGGFQRGAVISVVIPLPTERLTVLHQQAEAPAHLAVKGFHAVVPPGGDVIAELFAAE